ncbi:RloB domain-containing protein [bacterium]|nr:RloB domain-containing protein [bacterium]
MPKKNKRDQYFNKLKIQRPRVDFFVEGKVTESKYLTDLKNFLVREIYPDNENKRRTILGQIDIPRPGSDQDCEKLTDRAIEETKDKNEHDKVFVVIDEDDRTTNAHKTKLQNAIKKAKEHGIHFIYSIPNIEFWALLHFVYCPTEISKDDCPCKLKKYLLNYEKELDFSKMQNNISIAIENAKKIRKEHCIIDNKEIDLNNPTTNAFIILEELKDFIENFPD